MGKSVCSSGEGGAGEGWGLGGEGPVEGERTESHLCVGRLSHLLLPLHLL